MFAAPNLGHVNCLNMANAGMWVATVIFMTLSYFRVFGDPIEVLIKKYPTLLTPGEIVLRILPVIIVYQGIFALAQLTPMFRNNRFVAIIAPWWLATSLLQIQWVWELTKGTQFSIAYSMVLIFFMLGCLLGLLLVLDARKPNFFEYWLLRAPFSLHAGWAICASALNVNMWAAAVEQPAFPDYTLLCIAMLSLAWIFVLTSLFGLGTRRPDPLLCGAVAWCMYYVWTDTEVKPNFDREMVTSVEYACMHAWSGLIVLTFLATVTRISIVWVSNKLPDKIAEGHWMQAGQSVVWDD